MLTMQKILALFVVFNIIFCNKCALTGHKQQDGDTFNEFCDLEYLTREERYKDGTSFPCVRKQEGWEEYRRKFNINHYSTSGLRAPVITDIALYSLKNNNPTLKILFKVPNRENTEAILMEFKSVENDSFKDLFYFDNPRYRLFNLSSCLKHPVQRKLEYACVKGLEDRFDKTHAYVLTLTSFNKQHAPSYSLNYQITVYPYGRSQSLDWVPTIVTSVVPDTGNIRVVFEHLPSKWVLHETYYYVRLFHVTYGQLLAVIKVSHRSQKYECIFKNSMNGIFEVRLNVYNLTKNITIREAVSYRIEINSTGKTHLSNKFPMSITVLSATTGSALGVGLIIVMVLCYRKIFKQHANTFSGNKTVRVFILYSNHYQRDCVIAKAYENFLHKMDGVQVLFDKLDINKYMQSPKEVHKHKMGTCTHMMIIWSPGAREALSGGFSSKSETPVPDLFNFSLSLFYTLDKKQAFIVYLPEYEKIESLKCLPTMLRSVKTFNIRKDKEVKKLCKHLVGRIPDQLFIKAERTKAVDEIRKKVNFKGRCSNKDSGSEQLELLLESKYVHQPPMTVCPVHSPRNIRKEPPEIILHENENISPPHNSLPNNYQHQLMKQIDSDETFPVTRIQENENLQISREISEKVPPDLFESCSLCSFSSDGEEMVRINFGCPRTSLLPYSNNSGNRSFSHIPANPESIELSDHARHVLPGTNISSDESDEMDKYTSGYGTTSFQNQKMDLHKHILSQKLKRTDDANDTIDNTDSFCHPLLSQGDDVISRSIMKLMLDVNEITSVKI